VIVIVNGTEPSTQGFQGSGHDDAVEQKAQESAKAEKHFSEIESQKAE